MIRLFYHWNLETPVIFLTLTSNPYRNNKIIEPLLNRPNESECSAKSKETRSVANVCQAPIVKFKSSAVIGIGTLKRPI